MKPFIRYEPSDDGRCIISHEDFAWVSNQANHHIALLRKENEALQKQVSSLKKALVKLGLEQE